MVYPIILWEDLKGFVKMTRLQSKGYSIRIGSGGCLTRRKKTVPISLLGGMQKRPISMRGGPQLDHSTIAGWSRLPCRNCRGVVRDFFRYHCGVPPEK